MTAADAARVHLLGAGLAEDPTRRAGPAATARVIRDLGFVQLDSIIAIERAHHLILHARLDEYEHDHLKRTHERDRHAFEHWTHDASLIRIDWHHHWKHRFDRCRELDPTKAWWKSKLGPDGHALARRVLDRVRAEGPMRSRDFDDAEGGRAGPWWGWKPAKAALEWHWRSGAIAVAARDGFEKVYDLSERVHPEHHALPKSSAEEHLDWAASAALDRLGVATASEIARFFNAIEIADARAWCRRAVQDGRAREVLLGARDDRPPTRAVAVVDLEKRIERARSAPMLAAPDRIRPLAPFDPAARDRARLERLFGFEYRFEAFVPAAKRRYGYYVLPLLEGDRFVGRVDARTDRASSTLVVNDVWWEPGVRPTAARRRAFDDGLERLAWLVGAEWIERPT